VNSNQNLKYTLAYAQHCGLSHPVQQDALWDGAKCIQSKNTVTDNFYISENNFTLALADGVAISPSPQLASRFVLETIGEHATHQAIDARSIRQVHGHLCDRYAKGKTFGTSTTLVTASFHSEKCAVLNVGDSRAYRISSNGVWTQLSRDHTVLNAMIDRGEADPEIEYASFYNMLDSCLVADDEETEFSVHREEISILLGDSILLCTDGVHDTLTDSKMQQLTEPSLDPCSQIAIWRNAVLAAGAPDNFSMILLKRTGKLRLEG